MKKEIAKYQKAAFGFARKDKYDGCRFEKEWGGYKAFYVFSKDSKGACSGFPAFVLVDEELNTRYATLDETLEYLM